ncbi:MAG: chemotaxis protein CheX [Synergistaceae bacterium]|jgi:chemotaxis protein CheX|nr:chemotaxis protein CheX [Synergistaceae bacterium]
MEDKTTLPAVLVNSYMSSLISVSESVGIDASFVKHEMASGVRAQGSRAAAFIGIVGGVAQWTVALMADIASFEAFVNAFTGGMIKPNTKEPMSMSVLGEMTNMISGQALIKADLPGLDITPPQLFSGKNLKLSPSVKSNVKSFTLPFDVGVGRVYLVLSVYS